MECRFINSQGYSIHFNKIDCNANYILRRLEADNSVSIYSNKGMLQDGETYINNTIDIGHLDLHVSIQANNLDEIQSLKNRLYQVFNPKVHLGELYYKDKKIKCIIDEIPHFTSNNDTYIEGIISLTALDPYWTDMSLSVEDIALWRGCFHFPLVIPEDEGIIFGYREPNLIVNINNTGQVETGLIIKFKAKGPVTNPMLFDIVSRETLRINTVMKTGEVITVNTNYGQKSIIQDLNGVQTNILNKLDVKGGGDTFITLDVGDNIFRYDAEDGLDNLEIQLSYYNKYLGV